MCCARCAASHLPRVPVGGGSFVRVAAFQGRPGALLVRRAFAFVLRPFARGARRRWPSVCYGTPLEVVAPSYSSFRPLWRRACSSGRRLRVEVLKP